MENEEEEEEEEEEWSSFHYMQWNSSVLHENKSQQVTRNPKGFKAVKGSVYCEEKLVGTVQVVFRDLSQSVGTSESL